MDLFKANDTLTFVKVALPLPIDQTYTYSNPFQSIQKGHRVLVPFGPKMMTGYVVDYDADFNKTKNIKPINALLDDMAILNEELISLCSFVSKHYLYPLGEVFHMALPGGIIRQSRRVIQFVSNENANLLHPNLKLMLDEFERKKTTDLVHYLKKNTSALHDIKQLEKKGLIKTQTLVSQQRSKEQMLIYYKLTQNASIEGLKGPSQKKIYTLIENTRECERSSLLKQYPNASTIITLLEKKGLIEKTKKPKSALSALDDHFVHAPKVTLNKDQADAVDKIKTLMDQSVHKEVLLHGATGSGKTEVYLHLAKHALDKGQSVLALVPEISLTPQFVGRFKARLNQPIAVLHSGLSDSSRLTEWMRIRKGQAKCVIGARSAIFAPLENIGLILMDEEHDPSYKQDDGILYHARTLAKIRAKHHNCVLLYGSATPSIETFYQTQIKNIECLSLPNRTNNLSLPKVTIVDLKNEVSKFGKDGLVSNQLREAIENTIASNKQVILFLNRRGFSPIILCPKCGTCAKCKDCSVGLTFHANNHSYQCHYCDFYSQQKPVCQTCKQDQWVHLGFGTQSVENELSHHFPDARISRLDKDTVQSAKSYESVLKDFALHKSDILIGTQMVTKGLDIKNVLLVGVLLADQSLHFPDFRACETTFDLITQVVGRAGRGETSGQAIIQTYQSDHYAILHAQNQDYNSFYENEIKYRKTLGYPPFFDLHLFRFSSLDESMLQKATTWFAKHAIQLIESKKLNIEHLGPSESPLKKINKMYRFQMIFKSQNSKSLIEFSKWLYVHSKKIMLDQGVLMKLDTHPQRFL